MVDTAYANLHPEEHLGRDILVDADGDLVISPIKDLAQVRYSDNLKQAIVNRLRTQKGELALHPDYGSRLPELVGSPGNEITLGLIKLRVREALLQEPRIQEIDNVNVFFRPRSNNTIVDVDIEVSPIRDLNKLNMIFSLFI